MQLGQAAFILNWPYVLSAMKTAAATDKQSKTVLDDLGYAPYPSVVPGEKPKVTLGGMNYAISTYSKHPAESFEAAMCMRNPKNALSAAIDNGDVPALKSLFDNRSSSRRTRCTRRCWRSSTSRSPRPKTPLYQNISTIVSTTLSPPDSIDPQATADKLRSSISDALSGKGILP